MEPLQKRLDTLRDRGQDLIEAAGPGVNTGTLDAELETLNDKWAHLNERVNLCRLITYLVKQVNTLYRQIAGNLQYN